MIRILIPSGKDEEGKGMWVVKFASQLKFKSVMTCPPEPQALIFTETPSVAISVG